MLAGSVHALSGIVDLLSLQLTILSGASEASAVCMDTAHAQPREYIKMPKEYFTVAFSPPVNGIRPLS